MFKDIKRKKVLIPAILTMLNEDESFNEPAQRALVRWLLGKGVDGFYAGGSTGEGPLLCADIRRKLISAIVDEVAGRVPVIAYIGFADTRQSVEMAQYAQSAGADGVSAVPPYYYRYDFDAIYSFYREISQSVSIPMLVYYVQATEAMNTSDMEKLLGISNVCGLKFTGSDHYALQQVKLAAGDKYVFSGRDEQCLSGLVMGADGLIGSTYNVLPEIYQDIIESYTKGNLREAERQAFAANRALAELHLHKRYRPNLKALLRLAGIDAPTVRSPIRGITEEQFEDLRSRLAALRSFPELEGAEIIQKS